MYCYRSLAPATATNMSLPYLHRLTHNSYVAPVIPVFLTGQLRHIRRLLHPLRYCASLKVAGLVRALIHHDQDRLAWSGGRKPAHQFCTVMTKCDAKLKVVTALLEQSWRNHGDLCRGLWCNTVRRRVHHRFTSSSLWCRDISPELLLRARLQSR
jgi:hypothetical protein